MEEAISAIVNFLLSLGLPGLLIGGAGYWIKLLTERNHTLVDKVIDLGMKQAEQNAATVAALNQIQQTLLLMGKGPG